jgi:Nucleotidyl transferase AbiEii toxin, Type IV TA system
MPLTSIQSEVLKVISANRSPESHIAGGIALNCAPDSPRYSEDIDIFHDAEEAVVKASELDVMCLETAGFDVERQRWSPQFRRVTVCKLGESVKVEWAQDSAWRFFQIQRDAVLHWKLHPFDALTNKALAMAARAETRDLVDLVSHATGMYPLHAVVWAACAKDAGFTPLSLLEWMRRNARIDAPVLREMGISVLATELKTRWLELAELSEVRISEAAHAGIEPGVVFVGPNGDISWHTERGAVAQHAKLGGAFAKVEGARD